MQISNNITFKSAQFSRAADIAAENRMFSKEFIEVKKRFIAKYKKSPLIINVDTMSSSNDRFVATIRYKNISSQIIREGFFASKFANPNKFIEKLSNEIDNLEDALLGGISRGSHWKYNE